MVQADQDRKVKSVQKKVKQIHITFHDPNTTDEMVKFLTKLLLKNCIEQEVLVDYSDIKEKDNRK